MFSPIITELWKQSFSTGDLLYVDAGFSIYVDTELDNDENGMILTKEDKTLVTVKSPLAKALNLKPDEILSDQLFRQKLSDQNIGLHGADYLFYFQAGAAVSLAPAGQSRNVRQLTADDETVFAQFCAASSKEDLDAAYVELDHWLVFGAFENDQLVCVASMYPWWDSKLADMGVLTLPFYRGRGYARDTLHAISKHAASLGYEPQYRCQLDNEASVALAKTAGLYQFGIWDVILSANTSEPVK